MQFRTKVFGNLRLGSTSLLLIVLILSLLFSSANAASNSDWKVRYTLQVQIVADSMSISGDLKLWLANHTDTAIDSIMISNDSGKLLIDSILWHGSPIDSTGFRQAGGAIVIPLPASILPDQTETFLIRFNSGHTAEEPSKVNRLSLLTDWFPALVKFTELCASRERNFRLDKIPAKLAALIEIDSGFDLLIPGELLNEKTHYGLLETMEGTIIKDIAGLTDGVNKAVVAVPPDSRETKRYFVRGEVSPGFDLLIGKQIALDMLFHPGGRTIIGYDPSNKPEWIDNQIAEILKIQTTLDQFLPGDSSNRFILVDTSSVLQAISLELARSRVSLAVPWLRSNSPAEFEGFSYYVALATLHRLYGDEGMIMAPQLEATLRNHIISAASCEWYNVFKLIPTQLELTRHQLGDSLFQTNFLSILRRCESGAGAAGSDSSLHWIDELDSSILARADLSVKTASIEVTASGATVDIVMDGSEFWQPPVDICFYGPDEEQEIICFTRDQLWRTGGTAKISQMLDFMPHSVMIDPNGLLPDWNRDNNYFRLTDDAPVHGIFIETLFPPFREN